MWRANSIQKPCSRMSPASCWREWATTTGELWSSAGARSKQPRYWNQTLPAKKWNWIMGQKWKCKRSAGGPRGPPRLFPAVCPCEAVCAGFPSRVASLPHPAPKAALSQPAWPMCGSGQEHPGPLGAQELRGKKKVRDKAVASPLPTPSRNAGRGDRSLRFDRECRTIQAGQYGIGFTPMASNMA